MPFTDCIYGHNLICSNVTTKVIIVIMVNIMWLEYCVKKKGHYSAIIVTHAVV